MDSNIEISLERANNELLLARAVHLLSQNAEVKKETFNLPEKITFYSAVISHSYYSIFYGAKAYLKSQRILQFQSKVNITLFIRSLGILLKKEK